MDLELREGLLVFRSGRTDAGITAVLPDPDATGRYPQTRTQANPQSPQARHWRSTLAAALDTREPAARRGIPRTQATRTTRLHRRLASFLQFAHEGWPG